MFLPTADKHRFELFLSGCSPNRSPVIVPQINKHSLVESYSQQVDKLLHPEIGCMNQFVPSLAMANTTGIVVLVRFSSGPTVPVATMTSTFCRTNSAAISAASSGRPSHQRYSIVIVRPLLQPSESMRPVKAATQGRQADASLPKIPMMGSLPGCCERAASGQMTAAPPASSIKSRRRIAFPQAQDHANVAFNEVITAGI